MKLNRRPGYMFVILPLVVFIGIALFFVGRSRTFQFFGNIISHVNTTERIVALTFDDGPTDNADSILQILNRYNVKATFFLTGKEMSEHLSLTKKIINSGHSVGNHSYSHQRMVLKSSEFIVNEIETTDSMIRACGYKKQIYFRPPYCKKLF